MCEDTLDLKLQQEAGQDNVSLEECVQAVVEKVEDVSFEETVFCCDDESVYGEVVEVESLFDGGGNDMDFFDSLLSETGDDIPLSSSFDAVMPIPPQCLSWIYLFCQDDVDNLGIGVYVHILHNDHKLLQ